MRHLLLSGLSISSARVSPSALEAPPHADPKPARLVSNHPSLQAAEEEEVRGLLLYEVITVVQAIYAFRYRLAPRSILFQLRLK